MSVGKSPSVAAVVGQKRYGEEEIVKWYEIGYIGLIKTAGWILSYQWPVWLRHVAEAGSDLPVSHRCGRSPVLHLG